MRRFTCFFVLIFSSTALAKIAWPDQLISITSRYANSKLVSMNVEKKTESDFSKKNETFEGVIYFAKGKYRWEVKSPDKSLILFDGKDLWSEKAPDPDFPGPIEVTKTKLDKTNESQLILNSILSPERGQNHFKVVNTSVDIDKTQYDLLPIKPKGSQVKELKIIVDTKLRLVREAEFKDDIGNLTKLKFPKVLFYSSSRPELFIYKKPKGSQVIEL